MRAVKVVQVQRLTRGIQVRALKIGVTPRIVPQAVRLLEGITQLGHLGVVHVAQLTLTQS